MRRIERPESWLAIAVEARVLAAALTDPAAKRILGTFADECEEMADIAESLAEDDVGKG